MGRRHHLLSSVFTAPFITWKNPVSPKFGNMLTRAAAPMKPIPQHKCNSLEQRKTRMHCVRRNTAQLQPWRAHSTPHPHPCSHTKMWQNSACAAAKQNSMPRCMAHTGACSRMNTRVQAQAQKLTCTVAPLHLFVCVCATHLQEGPHHPIPRSPPASPSHRV